MWMNIDDTCQVSWDQRLRPVSRKSSSTICQASWTSPSLVTTSGAVGTVIFRSSTSRHVSEEVERGIGRGVGWRTEAEEGKGDKKKPKERVVARRVLWRESLVGIIGRWRWWWGVESAVGVVESDEGISHTFIFFLQLKLKHNNCVVFVFFIIKLLLYIKI